MTSLKTLLQDNTVQFHSYRKGYLYYTIEDLHAPGAIVYEFPVPIADCGDATFLAREKAIVFMRYIRQAQQDGIFVPLRPTRQ